jgi:hypothetical protein
MMLIVKVDRTSRLAQDDLETWQSYVVDDIGSGSFARHHYHHDMLPSTRMDGWMDGWMVGCALPTIGKPDKTLQQGNIEIGIKGDSRQTIRTIITQNNIWPTNNDTNSFHQIIIKYN